MPHWVGRRYPAEPLLASKLKEAQQDILLPTIAFEATKSQNPRASGTKTLGKRTSDIWREAITLGYLPFLLFNP